MRDINTAWRQPVTLEWMEVSQLPTFQGVGLTSDGLGRIIYDLRWSNGHNIAVEVVLRRCTKHEHGTAYVCNISSQDYCMERIKNIILLLNKTELRHEGLTNGSSAEDHTHTQSCDWG